MSTLSPPISPATKPFVRHHAEMDWAALAAQVTA